MAAVTAPGVPEGLSQEIARVLAFGVAVAAVLLAVGTAVVVVQGPTVAIGSADHVGLGTLANGGSLSPGARILAVGVVVLLLTPLARVVLSFAMFARSRDHAFAGLTAYVLVILAASVLLGLSP
jgi:uncharacterized membrane protein